MLIWSFVTCRKFYENVIEACIEIYVNQQIRRLKKVLQEENGRYLEVRKCVTDAHAKSKSNPARKVHFSQKTCICVRAKSNFLIVATGREAMRPSSFHDGTQIEQESKD